MIPRIVIYLAGVSLAVSLCAQATDGKTVSQYMRETGLQYLEIVHDYHYSPNAPISSEGENSTDRLIEALRKRMEIQVTSDADRQYLELLGLAWLTKSSFELAADSEAQMRVYRTSCFKDNGKPKRTTLSICQNPPVVVSESTVQLGKWSSVCYVEARTTYEFGSLAAEKCTRANLFSGR